MEKIIATPHIVAKENAFSKNVIIAGDPLRCQHIAKTFLHDAVQINSVRGMTAFTGKYRGMKISVMPHGMGMPSMAIYATELFTKFSVENIIRVGTCGAINKSLELKHMIVAKTALTNSNILTNLNATNTNCSKSMWKVATKHAELTQGTLFTSDLFYEPSKSCARELKAQCDAVEMETAVLYAIANKLKKNALSICTVTDFTNGKKGELTAEERQLGVDRTIKLALDILVEHAKNKK